MSFVTRVNANAEQAQKLFDKHLSKVRGDIKYSFDDEDSIEFFSCYTWSGKHVQWQLRGKGPCIISFGGFEDFEYCIDNAEELCPPMHKKLVELSEKVKNHFWKGGRI